ncbi:hypothetical protein HOY82DRAFT_601820 [Tuber indicum]|nr:hypothetical protein HOY82DRAFT_601820 [Tuber indicum]
MTSEKPDLSMEEELHCYVDTRDKRVTEAVGKMALTQDKLKEKRTAGYKAPQPGDLVLLQDFQLAKDKGRKLEPRWKTPRILERISKSGVSAHARQLHDTPGITKRYHLDNLLLFVPRTHDYPSAIDPLAATIPVVEYERDAMGDVQVVLDSDDGLGTGMDIGVDVIENQGTSVGGKV